MPEVQEVKGTVDHFPIVSDQFGGIEMSSGPAGQLTALYAQLRELYMQFQDQQSKIASFQSQEQGIVINASAAASIEAGKQQANATRSQAIGMAINAGVGVVQGIGVWRGNRENTAILSAQENELHGLDQLHEAGVIARRGADLNIGPATAPQGRLHEDQIEALKSGDYRPHGANAAALQEMRPEEYERFSKDLEVKRERLVKEINTTQSRISEFTTRAQTYGQTVNSTVSATAGSVQAGFQQAQAENQAAATVLSSVQQQQASSADQGRNKMEQEFGMVASLLSSLRQAINAYPQG